MGRQRRGEGKGRKAALVAIGLILLAVILAVLMLFTKAGRSLGSRLPYVDKIYAYLFLTPKVPDADVYGIDVSHYQGEIDWSAVGLIPYDLTTRIQRSDETSAAVSIGFVMVKATEGGTYVDDCRMRNMEAARRAGFIVGAYHVLTVSDPAQQAENFIANSGLVRGDMAPVIDLEESILGGDVTPKARKVLRTLVKKLEKRYGTKPIIYCGANFSKDFRLSADYAEYPKWIALYGAAQAPAEADFWQFTSNGDIPGVGGSIDLNAFYGRRFRLSDLRVRR